MGSVLLVLAACVPVLDPQSAIETGVAQTQQVSQLETAAAQAQGGGSTQTPVPPTAAATISVIDPSGFPPDFGTLSQQNGQWFWNETQVVFTQQAQPDGTQSVWMSLPNQTDWPLFVQSSQGMWSLGIAEWNGAMTIINTTELAVDLAITGGEGLTGSGEPQEKQITPYEIFVFSSLPPGDYDFHFIVGAGEFDCTLRFDQTSNFQFIIVPEGIAISEDHYTPQSAAEFNILNSPLCIH